MQLRTLLLLAWLALGLVLLVLWALDMPGGYVHLASPPVLRHQLALWVDGPSPNIRVELFWYNVITRSRDALLVEAPVWGLFPLLGGICAIMLADAVKHSTQAGVGHRSGCPLRGAQARVPSATGH